MASPRSISPCNKPPNILIGSCLPLEFHDADVARLHPVPSESLEAEIQAAGRRDRRALPCVRAGGGVPVRAEAQVHPVRRAEGEAVRAARLPRLRQERDRAGDLPRYRQPRAGGGGPWFAADTRT